MTGLEVARQLQGRCYIVFVTAYQAYGAAFEQGAVRLIAVDDVVYFQSDHGYTRVVTQDGEALIQSSLKELQEQLDPGHFWRIHRSTIVNASAISG